MGLNFTQLSDFNTRDPDVIPFPESYEFRRESNRFLIESGNIRLSDLITWAKTVNIFLKILLNIALFYSEFDIDSKYVACLEKYREEIPGFIFLGFIFSIGIIYALRIY
jgi:hypothetical protein